MTAISPTRTDIIWEIAFNPHWELDTEGRIKLPE
jgi:hypothetical protein